MGYVEQCDALYVAHEKLKRECREMESILISLYKAGVDSELLKKWYEDQIQAKMFLD